MNTKQNKTAQPALVIERTFNAPVSRVWRALTNKEDIKQWSFEMKEFKPQVGFEFQFYGEKDGVKYHHLCRITEAVPEKKLSYTWRYKGHEGNSLVTFELFKEGDKTRLKLTHEGLETFPQTPDFAKENFVAGWGMIIGENLKKYVETADREIIITRIINAPRERVWEAWTDPKQVAQWWGPQGFTTTIEEMDVRPGGSWKHTMHGPDGTDYPNNSVFIEVVKPERIVYFLSGSKEGGTHIQAKSTWNFEAQGNKTKVTIWMVFPTAEARDHVVKEYGAIEGGNQTLGRLDEFVKR